MTDAVQPDLFAPKEPDNEPATPPLDRHPYKGAHDSEVAAEIYRAVTSIWERTRDRRAYPKCLEA